MHAARAEKGKQLNISELSQLSSDKFYDQIKQIDSNVLIDMLKKEDDIKSKKIVEKLIKICMGKKYYNLVKMAVYN